MAEHEQATRQASTEAVRVRESATGRAEPAPALGPVLAPAPTGRAPARMGVPGLLALQRAAGNQAVATMLQREPVKEAKKVLSDTQVAQLADDVDRIQQELVRVEERGVAIGKIGLYYSSWLDAVNSAVATIKKEEAEKDASPLDNGAVMALLLGAFSMIAGPAVTAVVGVVGKRLGEVGGGVEKLIRTKAIEMAAAGGPKAITPSQEEIAAVVTTVKAKLEAKWKSVAEEAGKADLSAVLPKPKPAGTADTLDGVVAAMKQAQAVASAKAIDNTGAMNPAQLIALGKALDPGTQTIAVIQGRVLKELRSLVDTARAQAKTSNKTFRIDAWGSVGVAILKYTGVSIAASRKATYTFVSWIPPSTVEAMGGAEKYPRLRRGCSSRAERGALRRCLRRLPPSAQLRHAVPGDDRRVRRTETRIGARRRLDAALRALGARGRAGLRELAGRGEDVRLRRGEGRETAEPRSHGSLSGLSRSGRRRSPDRARARRRRSVNGSALPTNRRS